MQRWEQLSLKIVRQDSTDNTDPQDTSQQNIPTRIYTNSIFLILNSGAGAGLGFFYWAVAARVATPEHVGLGLALVSSSGLLSFFGSLGLGYGLIRYLSASRTGTRLINTCLTYTGIATATLTVVFLLTVSLWNPSLSFVSRSIAYSAVYVILVVIIAFFGLLSQTFVSFRRADFSVLQTVIFGLTKIGMVFIMVSLFQVFGIFASWGIGATIAVCISLLFLIPKLHSGYHPTPDFGRGLGKDVFRFSLANFIAEGFWNTPNWLLPLIITGFLGGEANAYFYVSWSLAGLLFTIPNSISLSLFAEGSHREDTLPLNIKKGLKLAFVLIPIGMLLLLVLGNKLLTVFGQQYATGGTPLLMILVPAVLPLSINAGYLGILRIRKRLKETVVLVVFIAIVVIMLSYLLMPLYGIRGAGLGWLIGQSIACIYTLPKMIMVAIKKPNPD